MIAVRFTTELFCAGVIGIGLLVGLAKAALDHAGDGLPLAIAADTVSPAFLPKQELKPWPSRTL